MADYVIHPRIVSGGTFDPDPNAPTQWVRLQSLDEVEALYEAQLKLPVARRIAEARREYLAAVADDVAAARRIFDVRDPVASLAPVETERFRRFVNRDSPSAVARRPPRGGDARDPDTDSDANPPDPQYRALMFSMPNMWGFDLYRYPQYKGRKFPMSVRWSDIDFDLDLRNDDFDDRTSSIDTGKLVIAAVVADRTNLKGNRLWFFRDKPDLRDVDRPDSTTSNKTWNNCVSSAACCGVSFRRLITWVAGL